MKWNKKGLICSHDTLDLEWYARFSMVPIPYLLNESVLRIFITMCDSDNVGRIGYVDVLPEKPDEILGWCQAPCLDIGEPGTFDDNGVVTASILDRDGELFLYYSGYRLGVNIPYTIFAGVAVSRDHGQSFQRVSSVPIMQRSENEQFCKCAPYVIPENEGYRVYYVGDHLSGWITGNDHPMPLYNLKTFNTRNLTNWGKPEGSVCINVENDDEHGVAKPTFWYENGIHKVIYSVRTFSRGYRLGYAESSDGVTFARKDHLVGIDVSASGFDSDMICFPARFRYRNKVYLFYSGNNYGLDGFGYAELAGD